MAAHPRGRQPIGVDQPPYGGSVFPFVHPSDDVRRLFGDLYLQYEDDDEEFRLPFRLAWAFGFGTEPVSESESELVPVHDRDVLILDADGRTVFDSTQGDFRETPWPDVSPRLRVVQWTTTTAVLRVAWHTAWTQAAIDSGEAVDYPSHLVPGDGELDVTTCVRTPRRLRSLATDDTSLPSGGPVVLEAGYNVRIDVTPPAATAVPGLLTGSGRLLPRIRRATRVTVNVVPGAGLGRYPGCEGLEPVLRKLGGATADAAGNLVLDASGCLRLQRPVGLVDADPRRFRYLHADLSEEQAVGALELRNDCRPCCDCDYYVRTYEGVRRRWEAGQAIADGVQSARDLYVANRARWLEAKACREARALRPVLVTEPECRVAVGATFCNGTTCCLSPIRVRFTLRYYDGGSEATPPSTTDCSQARISGSAQKGVVEDYSLIGNWPVYEVDFDFADPQAVSRAAFRLCLGGCGDGQTVGVVVTAHFGDVEGCVLPTVDVPEDLSAVWDGSALGQPSLPTRYLTEELLTPLSDRNAFCRNCEC